MIGFLGGTGPEGRGLALRLGLAGESVMIGSRDELRAREAADRLMNEHQLTQVKSGLNYEVARSSDVLFITVPFEGQRATLEEVGEHLAGKVVVDTVAPVAVSGGQFYTRNVEEGSAALQAQAILPHSKLVAAFQNISARDLLDPTRDVEGDVVVCGDDGEAKRLVMTLAERIPSLRAIDGGGLEISRCVEGVTALLLNINRLYKAHSTIKIVGL